MLLIFDLLFQNTWTNLLLPLVYGGILWRNPSVRRKLLKDLDHELYIAQVWVAPLGLALVALILFFQKWRLDHVLELAFSLLNFAVFVTWCREAWVAFQLTQPKAAAQSDNWVHAVLKILALTCFAIAVWIYVFQGWRMDLMLHLAFALMGLLVLFPRVRDWLAANL